MALKAEGRLFAKPTTKLGLATTIAALWLTALPIASAVAQGAPGQTRGGPSGMQPLGPTISATRVGQHPNPSLSDLHGPTWPTRMIGKARHSELIANGNALCAIEKHCSGRTLRTCATLS